MTVTCSFVVALKHAVSGDILECMAVVRSASRCRRVPLFPLPTIQLAPPRHARDSHFTNPFAPRVAFGFASYPPNNCREYRTSVVGIQVDADFLAMIKEAEDDESKGAEGAPLDVDPADDK